MLFLFIFIQFETHELLWTSDGDADDVAAAATTKEILETFVDMKHHVIETKPKSGGLKTVYLCDEVKTCNIINF